MAQAMLQHSELSVSLLLWLMVETKMVGRVGFNKKVNWKGTGMSLTQDKKKNCDDPTPITLASE